MSMRNYKVYADIGINRPLLVQRVAVLDTGAQPNFIKISELRPEDLRHVVMKELPDIRDADWSPIKTAAKLELLVRLGLLVVHVELIFSEILAAPVVIVCNYCDQLIETARRRAREVELEDGSTVPIVRKPSLRDTPSSALLPSEELNHAGRRASRKIRVAAAVELILQSEIWTWVTTRRHGLLIIQPKAAVNEEHGIPAANSFPKCSQTDPSGYCSAILPIERSDFRKTKASV